MKEYCKIKIEDLHIDADTVRKKMNISKAPGPDRIQSQRHCTHTPDHHFHF